MQKKIIAVLAGLVAGVVTVAITESIGHMIYPPPEGLDLSDKEAMKTFMSEIPLGAQIAVMIAWFLGSFVAAATALKLSDGDKRTSWIPVGLLLLGGLGTTFMFPHPIWMVIGAIVVPLMAGLLAQKLFASR